MTDRVVDTYTPEPLAYIAGTQFNEMVKKSGKPSILHDPVMLELSLDLLERHFVGNNLEDVHVFEQVEALIDRSEGARIDSLTKLPNRVAFQERLLQAIARNTRHKKGFAVLMIDLDQFKQYNDAYEHKAGDELLQAVAKAIQSHIRAEDIVARWGGDEFIALLENGNMDETTMKSAFFEKQLPAINQEINAYLARLGTSWEGRSIDGQETHMSVGMCFVRETYLSPDKIIAKADSAAYKEKKKRRMVRKD